MSVYPQTRYCIERRVLAVLPTLQFPSQFTQPETFHSFVLKFYIVVKARKKPCILLFIILLYSLFCFFQGTKGISTQTLRSLIYERGQTFRSQSQLQDLRNNLEAHLKLRVRDLQTSQGKSTPHTLPLTLCKNTHTPHMLWCAYSHNRGTRTMAVL